MEEQDSAGLKSPARTGKARRRRTVAQNILPTPQAEFAALGFYGEPLNEMIQRSFEEQNQGLANTHGYKMISPYIDPSGAQPMSSLASSSSSFRTPRTPGASRWPPACR